MRSPYLSWAWRGCAGMLFAALVSLSACSSSPPAVMDGDVIFQTSKSSQSLAVQRATHSQYSHMGIIFLRDGNPYVLEASATVRYTPLEKWVAHGRGGSFVVKRTHNPLSKAQIDSMKVVARTLEGRPYDLAFEWSDSRMYCSELVWKIYDRGIGLHVGELQALRDFDLTDPVVREKLKERYGDAVPMDEPVISPAAMFESPTLEVVAKVGV